MGDEIQFNTDGQPFPDAPAPDAGQVAPGTAAEPAEAVLAEIEQRQGDSAFMAKYLDGDAAAVAQMQRLYAQAFGGGGEAAPAEQAEFSDALAAGGARSSDPMDLARQAAFAPAAGPWAFEGLLRAGQSADETEAGIEIAQALHASGLPVGTAETLREIGARIARGGGAGDPEGAISAGMKELEKRHGADAAQLVADAREAFEHLDATHPALGDALLDAGLASDPDAIAALANWVRAARGTA